MNSLILRNSNFTNPKISPNFKIPNPNFPNFIPKFQFTTNRRNFSPICRLNSSIESTESKPLILSSPIEQNDSLNRLNFVEFCNPNPNFPPFVSVLGRKFSFSDQAFFLLTFIAVTTSAALISFVAAAVPSLRAMERAANSLTKLADAAREELPSTMAAIRLSSMEISDLTLELSDLSQEITEGVNKSAQAVQAAENGIRHIGDVARKQTASLILERATLPVINLQPVVSGAAEKTSRAVVYAKKTFMNLITGVEFSSDDEEESVDSRDT